MTTAPFSMAAGTSASETDPPAEKKAISTFVKLSGVASSTIISSLKKINLFSCRIFRG